MKRKILSAFFVLCGCLLLPACTKTEEVKLPEVEEPVKVMANIDFEDGKSEFVCMGTAKGDSDLSNLSVADFGGSKALKVENVDGGAMYLGIDTSALLGDKIANVKKIQMDIGVSNKDGQFHPCAGKLYAYAGEDRLEKEVGNWSVYLDSANPKTVYFDVADAGLIAGNSNFIVLSKEDDSATDTKSDIYIDNIAFVDEAGNVIDADTTAKMEPVKGFADPPIEAPEGSVVIEYSGEYPGDWSQDGTVGVDVLSQFEGQDVTFTYSVGYVPDLEYYLYGVMDASMGWSKLASQDHYNDYVGIDFADDVVEGSPWHLQGDGFLKIDDITNNTLTFTVSADRISKVISKGVGIGAQTYGVYAYYVIVSGSEPATDGAEADAATEEAAEATTTEAAE